MAEPAFTIRELAVELARIVAEDGGGGGGSSSVSGKP